MRDALVLMLTIFFMASVVRAEDTDDLIVIYGSLRPEVIGRFPEGGDGVRRMDDGYSRIGVKGSAMLTETLSGFYKYERRVSANDGEDDGAVRGDHNELRQVHVGISGNFGSVSIGRHYGLYYDYIDDELDRHRSHYSDAIVFGDLFVSNAVVYRSRDFNGSNFGVLVELNDADNAGNAVDERIEIAGTFRFENFAIHAGYVNAPVHDGLYGLASSFKFGAVNVVGVFQRMEKSNNNKDDLFSGALDVDLTPKNTLKASVTLRKEDARPDELYVIGGIDHRFSDRFLIFAEFFRKSTDVSQPGDESALIAGFRFDF